MVSYIYNKQLKGFPKSKDAPAEPTGVRTTLLPYTKMSYPSQIQSNPGYQSGWVMTTHGERNGVSFRPGLIQTLWGKSFIVLPVDIGPRIRSGFSAIVPTRPCPSSRHERACQDALVARLSHTPPSLLHDVHILIQVHV